MSSPLGFSREPSRWQVGSQLPYAPQPQEMWDKPPLDHWLRRDGDSWCLPQPLEPKPFPGPATLINSEEDRRWVVQEHPLPPVWNGGLDIQRPEDCFRKDWLLPHGLDHRPFPEPANFPQNEEDRRQKDDFLLLPLRNDREENQGPKDCFRERWYLQQPQPIPGYLPWNELPIKEQHPPWPPARLPGERGSSQDVCPSRSYYDGKRFRRARRDHRELTLVQRLPCAWPCEGKTSLARSSPSPSGTSQPVDNEKEEPPDTLEPLLSPQPDSESEEQTAQGLPAASENITESPGLADTPLTTPDTDPEAVMEAAELEEAEGATLVQAEAAQTPEDSHSQDSSASETEPAAPNENYASTGQHLKGQQHLPSAAGETEAEAANHELSGDLQPSENPQVSPGASTKPDVQPNQDFSDTHAVPETSPGTQHSPRSNEEEPAAGSWHQPCSTPLAPSMHSRDLRSAAVLARKEEIELSYQQFCLTIAVVATMLLQKEPSMEAALGLALRANLRQGRLHHLQKLEDFINSYDSDNLSCWGEGRMSPSPSEGEG